MDTNQIETILKDALSLDEVYVKADGSHFEIIAVGACFDGVTRVKQQQMVYKPLMDKIQDGSMHAISIKAYTPEQWAKDKKLVMPS